MKKQIIRENHLLKTIVALSYFNRRIGPIVFYSYPKNLLDKDLSVKIADIMVQQFSEGFFIHSFENLKSMNYYFKIHSDWAKTNKETLMVSIILDHQISPELEDKISILCTEFSEQLQSNEEIYTGFYINEKDYHEEDIEIILKNNSLIEAWVDNLYWAIIEDSRGISEEEKISLLLDDSEGSISLEMLKEDRHLYDEYLKRLKNIKIFAEIAIKKIKSLMKKESVNELTINRKYLPEIFNADLLEISKNDGFPTLKPFVLEYFSAKRILIELYGNVIIFKKIKKN